MTVEFEAPAQCPRRAAPFPAAQQERIAALMEAHRALPRPEQARRVIGISRKATAG